VERKAIKGKKNGNNYKGKEIKEENSGIRE